MSYNIEWFDNHFEADNSMKTGAKSVAKFDGVAAVLSEIDPDLVGITEAPNTTTTTGERNTVAALEGFAAARGLRQRKALMGFPSAGRQEIAVLYDPDVFEVTHDPDGRKGSVSDPPFNEQFQMDSDGDGIKELYKHYRPPLEAKVTRKDGGDDFWLMVVHAKSKGIFDAMDRVHFERASERNRRKLFAECTSIRNRATDWLHDGRPVVVMGDINDGPGFDFYEGRFGRSAVEVIMGSIFEPEDILCSHLGMPKWGRYGWEPSTARFTDAFTGDTVNALIDHILASRKVAVAEGGAKVWNPWQLDLAEPLKPALRDGSDHFPVTLDIL
ncbi:endonuclease/exonuclease/phosphatase family protein [Rhodovulum sp. P5]|uniref:endonuclease/exonuclease/phosphatase family protein n=1 Tax=Rhodovulum sp. P5 TaxID=1564506 RepID=UPI00155F72A6|nr:endonuclease/exonuclease/phosphatase family protein [Rhodovulum sp. P5]